MGKRLGCHDNTDLRPTYIGLGLVSTVGDAVFTVNSFTGNS